MPRGLALKKAEMVVEEGRIGEEDEASYVVPVAALT